MLDKDNNSKYDVVVVIPFYNEEKYITATLKCLREQKLETNLSWLVLFVDNNSTDKTQEIIRNYFDRTNIPYKLIYEQKKGTVYSRTAGLNAALKFCKRLIVSTDADTTFADNFISSTVKDFTHAKSDVICGQQKTEPKISLWKRIVAKDIFNTNRKIWNLEYRLFGPYFFGSYFAISKDLYATIPLYEPEIHERYMGEDILLSRRSYYVGATFIKSSVKVSPNPRKILRFQQKSMGSFVGNNIEPHRIMVDSNNLNFKKLSKEEIRKIQNRLTSFEVKRLLWSAADAGIFWHKTGKKYGNSLKSALDVLAFIGENKYDPLIFEMERKKLYNHLIRKYLKQGTKILTDYLTKD